MHLWLAPQRPPPPPRDQPVTFIHSSITDQKLKSLRTYKTNTIKERLDDIIRRKPLQKQRRKRHLQVPAGPMLFLPKRQREPRNENLESLPRSVKLLFAPVVKVTAGFHMMFPQMITRTLVKYAHISDTFSRCFWIAPSDFDNESDRTIENKPCTITRMCQHELAHAYVTHPQTIERLLLWFLAHRYAFSLAVTIVERITVSQKRKSLEADSKLDAKEKVTCL